jgi:hypothetical protein
LWWAIRTFVHGIRTFVQNSIDIFVPLSKIGIMKATNMEIAKAALCSEGAVRKARERLDLDDLGVLLGWVLGQRVKEMGLGAVDGLAEVDKPEKPLGFLGVVRGSEVPQPERHWTPVDEDGVAQDDFS